MMERHMQLWQLDLLMHPDGAAIQNQRLDALNRTEITSLLKLLLNECVAGAAKATEAANEQDHA
jgi:hypothetical protein